MEKNIIIKIIDVSNEDGIYPSEMRVIYSTHDRFIVDSRFDYGFMNIAIKEGYTIIILPTNQD